MGVWFTLDFPLPNQPGDDSNTHQHACSLLNVYIFEVTQLLLAAMLPFEFSSLPFSLPPNKSTEPLLALAGQIHSLHGRVTPA